MLLLFALIALIYTFYKLDHMVITMKKLIKKLLNEFMIFNNIHVNFV